MPKTLNPQSVYILRHETISEDSVLRAFQKSGELLIFDVVKDRFIEEAKGMEIINYSILLRSKGYLRDIPEGFEITLKGKWHLLVTNKTIQFWGFIIALLAIVLTAWQIVLAMQEKNK